MRHRHVRLRCYALANQGATDVPRSTKTTASLTLDEADVGLRRSILRERRAGNHKALSAAILARRGLMHLREVRGADRPRSPSLRSTAPSRIARERLRPSTTRR